jgi:ribulose-phosphate 3-epimerase
MAHIAPSILSADFARLGEEIGSAERGGARLLHVDVMDGRFVPNITIGPPVVASIRKITRLPLDCHLMIVEPDRYIEEFARSGADWITVHQEAAPHLHRTVARIRELGKRTGVAINPSTPVTTLEEVIADLDHVLVMSVNPGFGGQTFIPRAIEKIKQVKTLIERSGSSAEIEVDGGIGKANIGRVVTAGARWIVAGSAVFSGGQPERAVRELAQLAGNGGSE